MEAQLPKRYGADVIELPGSRSILDDLEKAGAPWAIVTSGTRPLVTGWLDVMKLAHPKNLVTAEDVRNGKPDPECYSMGASKLGFVDEGEKKKRVLVLEDAAAGVRAGKAAGFEVVALATTHAIEQLKEAGADWIVRDLRSVVMKGWDRKTGLISIEISDALVSG
jgi:glycerol-1-phosphatase